MRLDSVLVSRGDHLLLPQLVGLGFVNTCLAVHGAIGVLVVAGFLIRFVLFEW